MLSTKSLFFSLTTRCNVQCKKCWRSQVWGKGKDINLDVLNKFMEIFSDYRGKIIIGSGENLLCKHIEKYIEWVCVNNINTTILTTGFLFDSFIDKQHFFVKNIVWGVTLDGFYNNEIANLQYGLDLERVKQNLRNIKKRYPDSSFYINLTHTKSNLDSTEKILLFAHELNIKEVYITQLKLFEGLDDTYTKSQVNDVTSREFINIMKNVEELSKKLNIKLYAPLTTKEKKCFVFPDKLSPIIHTNGDIIFCYGKDGDVIGNILDQTGDSVWKEYFLRLIASENNMRSWCGNCNATRISNRGYYYLPQKSKS